MTIELGLFFSGVAALLGIAAFFIGRQTAAKNDGREWGEFTAELKVDVRHIKDDVAEVKTQNKIISDQYADIRTDVAVVKRDLKTAFSKIDDIRLRGSQ